MKTLIIGAGEVGKALKEVIEKTHETHLKDLEPLELTGIEVLQICYPEHAEFIHTTQNYINQYKPTITIINSSVAVGTSDNFDDNVVYSPIRGRHNRVDNFGKKLPGLEFDIPRYVKFVFGVERSRKVAVEYFKECGIECYDYECHSRQDGELLKLISNVHMGLEIAWRQEVARILKHYHASETTYDNWERSYNRGYSRCGDDHLLRPLMKPGPIGGHCILPCTEMLSRKFPSKAFDFIRESNASAATIPKDH